MIKSGPGATDPTDLRITISEWLSQSKPLLQGISGMSIWSCLESRCFSAWSRRPQSEPSCQSRFHSHTAMQDEQLRQSSLRQSSLARQVLYVIPQRSQYIAVVNLPPSTWSWWWCWCRLPKYAWLRNLIFRNGSFVAPESLAHLHLPQRQRRPWMTRSMSNGSLKELLWCYLRKNIEFCSLHLWTPMDLVSETPYCRY